VGGEKTLGRRAGRKLHDLSGLAVDVRDAEGRRAPEHRVVRGISPKLQWRANGGGQIACIKIPLAGDSRKRFFEGETGEN
jgi:hypothetical protein